MKIRIVVFLLLISLGKRSSGQENSLVPKPVYYEELEGGFLIDEETKILVDTANCDDLISVAKQLANKIFDVTGLSLSVLHNASLLKDNYIALTCDSSLDSLGEEGYSITVNKSKVCIAGMEVHGVFYGVQSLIQLLQNSPNYEIPAAYVYDKPRFEWRGMMLDVGRYFYSVPFIKKMIDNMSVYKMNTFHWHLTENQGWRIEIKKYPELTEKGAWRSATQFARGIRGVDNHPHGGFYTQEEIKEVVAYAKTKFVKVIPEIEMPGHSLAALSVYPELSCSGGPFVMDGEWRMEEDIFCAGNEKTFEFLEDILTEVTSLFPERIIHIGGDEAPKKRWKACPKCQARINAEGLKDEHELQSYFIKRIENFLLTKKKNIIGWDEILEGGLAPNAMVMSWRGTKGGIEAAKFNQDVVMSPNNFMYFDYCQGEAHLEPYSIGNYLPIQKVYSYDPVPKELNASEVKYIKGIQANIWSEFIHSPELVEYMAFPRLAAAAEVGWTNPELKNWDDFARRLEFEFSDYKRKGINFSKSIYNVEMKAELDSINLTATVALKAYSYNSEIRYTLNGEEPNIESSLYKEPLQLKLPQTIKAASFRKGKRLGKVNTRSFAIIK